MSPPRCLVLVQLVFACARPGAAPLAPPADPPPWTVPPPGSAPAASPVAAPPEPVLEDSPPLDRDGDQLPDADDRCPDEPETFNGFGDDDGCPDELPVRIIGCFGPSPDRPRFAAGSHSLREPDRRVLRHVGAVLRDFPEVRLRLIGHADAREGRSDGARVSLGRRRAEAVRTYLVEHERIDPARLEIDSQGATRPIDPRDTATSRAVNRRVEFEVAARIRPPLERSPPL